MTEPRRPPASTAARGAAELALAQLGGPVLQAVQLLVVSHLLTTADVGRWALPAAMLAGEATLLEVGLHLVLSRARLDDQERLARRWGVAATAAHLAIAGGAWWLGASWALLAVTLLPAPALSAAAAVGRADLARAGSYRRLARLELEAAGASAAVTVATAAAIGPWSFVAGALARLVLLAARARPGADVPPGRPARPREAHVVVLLYAFVFLAGNVDYALAGWLLPVGGLGVYFLAFNLASVPAGRVGFAVNRVIVSRAEAVHGPQAADLVFGTVTAVGLLLGALVVLGAPAVPVVLGDRWAGVVDPTRALGATTAAALLANAVRAVAVARHEDRQAVAAMATTAGLVAAAIVVTRPDDPTGIATVVAAATVLALGTWWAAFAWVRRGGAVLAFAAAAGASTTALALVDRAPVLAGAALLVPGGALAWRWRAALGAVTGRRSPP